MYDQIKAMISRWHALRDVNRLTDRELEDLGMTRAQVLHFVRMPSDVPDRVAAMAQIFKLSPEDVKANHGRYLDLLDTCGTCGHRRACKLVLGQGDTARATDVGFCPNAPEFRSMAET